MMRQRQWVHVSGGAWETMGTVCGRACLTRCPTARSTSSRPTGWRGTSVRRGLPPRTRTRPLRRKPMSDRSDNDSAGCLLLLAVVGLAVWCASLDGRGRGDRFPCYGDTVHADGPVVYVTDRPA